MQTQSNSHENTNTRTFIIGALVGVAAAAALAAGFMLGAGAGSKASDAAPVVFAGDAAAQSQPADGGAPAAPQQQDGEVNGAQEQPEDAAADTATPAQTEEEDDPTATPTASPTETPEPGDGCQFCGSGDLVLPPPPVDPCPLCDNPNFLAPIDVVGPEIQDIGIEICNAHLLVDFKLDEEAEVWLSWDMGDELFATPHAEFEYQVNIDYPMEWELLLVDYIYIHAMDIGGNHTQAGPFEMPELKVC